MAGGVVAVVAGAVGFFLVLRNLAFAGHALSHVGFAGATGSLLIGVGALWGLLAFTLAAAVAMGLLGDRLRNRDVAVGVVLSLALGFGVLFLYLYTTSATEATAILFGNLLGVSRRHVVDPVGTGRADPRRSRRDLPAVAVRDLGAGIGRGQGRVLAARLGAVSGGRRRRRRRSRAGGRRPARVRADGRAGGGGAAADRAPRPRRGLGGHSRRRGNVERDCACLRHRLADDVLDRAVELPRLFRKSVETACSRGRSAGALPDIQVECGTAPGGDPARPSPRSGRCSSACRGSGPSRAPTIISTAAITTSTIGVRT